MISPKVFQPRSSIVVSFEAHTLQRPLDFVGEIVIEEQDENEYVFEIAKNEDSSKIAAALSNRSVVFYDGNMTPLGKFDGHTGTVNDVIFAGHDVILSACEDRKVRGWDIRSKNQVFEVTHDDEVMNMSLGCGGTMLATASGMGAHFIDMRTSKRIGFYSDNHTDIVTQVCFNNGGAEVATGSEDGLVCIYDTTQAKAEDSVQAVINADCAIRKIGFFAPGGEGMYVLTGSETLSLWHKNSAQCINPQHQDARHLLSTSNVNVDYLVDCHYNPTSEKLLLTAADWNGVTSISEVTNSSVLPLASLTSGHRSMVRSSMFISQDVVLTGGEDSRICAWDLSASPPPATTRTSRPTNGRKSGGREVNGRERSSLY
mmetsp:Transcript_52758/g.67651  ORF Transcript_52758/g.67651 Transcript_52758/m.67651 type:complete len:372 (+) Transcript_52758:48-1163(+)